MIAREQIQDMAALSNDAVFGGGWSWPVKVCMRVIMLPILVFLTNVQGLLHLFSRPSLLSPIKPLIIKSTVLTFAVTALLFVVGYFPTVVVLAFLNGPLAFVAAVPVILGAGSAIGLSISRIIWLSTAQVDLFDEVRKIVEWTIPTLFVACLPTDSPLRRFFYKKALERS